MNKNQRPFAVFDIDGTLIRWQLYHAIADALVKLGYLDGSVFSPIRSARMDWKKRSASFKHYEHQLVSAYDAAIKNLPVNHFEQAAQAVFDEYKDQTYIYTRELINQLKSRGYLLFAISGSQSEIVEKIASHYGFDDYLGTEYERSGGKFTGKFTFHAAKKDKSLKTLVERNAANFRDSVAVGDSASDIAMLGLVGTPIAFNPERELFEYARTNNWRVVVERKNMVYELGAKDGQYRLVKTN